MEYRAGCSWLGSRVYDIPLLLTIISTMITVVNMMIIIMIITYTCIYIYMFGAGCLYFLGFRILVCGASGSVGGLRLEASPLANFDWWRLGLGFRV